MKSFLLLLPAALLFALVVVSAPLGASATTCQELGGSCDRTAPPAGFRVVSPNDYSPACPVSGGLQTRCIAPDSNVCQSQYCSAACGSGTTQDSNRSCTGGLRCCMPVSNASMCTPSNCFGTCPSGSSVDPLLSCSDGLRCCTGGSLGTGTTTNASNCVKNAQGQCSFANPLAFDTVEGFLAQILSWLRSIVVALALVVIVIGGLLYITSAGDEGKAETAKKWITGAMIGLAIVFLAPTIFNELGSILGWTGTSATGAKTVAEILKSVLMFLLALAGSIALIMLVVGGFMYLFAGVDEHRAETGKDIVKYSVIGLIIIMSSYVIVQTVASLFA